MYQLNRMKKSVQEAEVALCLVESRRFKSSINQLGFVTFLPDNVRLSLLASCELSPINIYHFGDDLRSRTEPGERSVASRVPKSSKYLTNTNIRRLLFVEKKPHSQKRVFEKSKMKLFTVLPLAALGQFGDPAQMAQMVLPMIKQFYNSEFFFIPESISK